MKIILILLVAQLIGTPFGRKAWLILKMIILNNEVPYANLHPEVILDAIESTGLLCSGSLLALNSYENRVYQVGLEDAPPIIAKFYRPQRWSDAALLEEHQFALELVEHEIPIVAPWMSTTQKTLHHYQGYRFALFKRWGGHALELDSLPQLEWMGRFMGRLHAIGTCRSFQNRPKMDVQSYGYNPYHFLIEKNYIPAFLKDKYCHVAESVLAKIESYFQQAGTLNYIRLHGDMHVGNVLWSEAGPHIVDLDDCMMGPAIQDIWMLLSGDKMQIQLQLEYILSGYREFCDFNLQELHLIEALRTLRMFHYSGWLAKRWADPAFPISFPWFNTSLYWQEQLQNLHDQDELLT
ncbi:MAG: yihE [Gammaproteobacteria bacterium]|jgi:Ser/Thr protein kinase RdoA (MazF antagonist)|nr:yihE [Gammaproteobacteria bacterium]